MVAVALGATLGGQGEGHLFAAWLPDDDLLLVDGVRLDQLLFKT